MDLDQAKEGAWTMEVDDGDYFLDRAEVEHVREREGGATAGPSSRVSVCLLVVGLLLYCICLP